METSTRRPYRAAGEGGWHPCILLQWIGQCEYQLVVHVLHSIRISFIILLYSLASFNPHCCCSSATQVLSSSHPTYIDSSSPRNHLLSSPHSGLYFLPSINPIFIIMTRFCLYLFGYPPRRIVCSVVTDCAASTCSSTSLWLMAVDFASSRPSCRSGLGLGVGLC